MSSEYVHENNQHLPLEAVPVTEFSSNYGEGADVFEYPGQFPRYSFVTDGNLVYALHTEEQGKVEQATVFAGGKWKTIDEYLTDNGLPAMEERIPIIAYGANMNPNALKDKFGGAGDPRLETVIAVNATLSDYAVVAHEKPGIKGNVFAELGRVEGCDSEIKVLFLTPEQVLLLHKTEPSYNFGILQDADLKLASGEKVPVMLYAGNSSILLDEKGQPIRFSDVSVKGAEDLLSLSSKEMLAYILAIEGVQEALESQIPQIRDMDYSPESYALLMRDLGDKSRIVPVQSAIASVLRESGRIGDVSLGDKVLPLSRSMTDTLPTLRAIREINTGKEHVVEEQLLGRMAVQVLKRGENGLRNEKQQAAIDALVKYLKSRM